MARQPYHYAAARRSYIDEVRAAARDFVESFGRFRLWSTLAVNDIASRYRGSILGPFWIVVAQAAFVAGITVVYGDLMHVPIEKYIPWMTTGVVLWSLIAQTIQESTDAFIAGSVIIRQTSIPLPTFVWRVVCRNLFSFLHQIVVVLAVALWFHYFLRQNVPLFLVGMVLVILNLGWICFMAAIAAARYRDVQQAIVTGLQLAFFVTPVIWIPSDMHGARSSILLLNPVYHMLEVTRAPLLGEPANFISYEVLVGMAIAGWAITFLIYGAVRRRVVHYL